MKNLTNMDNLFLGNWSGINHVWLKPSEDAHISDTMASITSTERSRFLQIRYTWAYDGEPQDGFFLIGSEGEQDLIKAVWTDSWHMQDAMMICHGSRDPLGNLSLLGSYSAPSGPDWGWRILVNSSEPGSLRITMMNITPDGLEMKAVEAIYHRKPKLEIIPYQERWPVEFSELGKVLRQGLGALALRIDHIGSTAVPGLAAKDVIDIQITVAALDQNLLTAMNAIGYTNREGYWRDHRLDYIDSPDPSWEKWLFEPPKGQRRTHTHVRVLGRPNQRYPLLFRDYLRAHQNTARSYAELKRRLAKELADPLTYPDVKDPAVDLIYLAAEEWALTTSWQPGPSDA